jgi:hypothetical protein
VAPDDVLCEPSFITEGTIDASSIVVVSGHASAGKVVAVDGMDDESIRAAIRAPHRSAVHVLKPRST